MDERWMDGWRDGGRDGWSRHHKADNGLWQSPLRGRVDSTGDRGGSGWCQKRLGLLAMKSQVVVMLSTNESRPETHMGQGRGCVGFEQVGPASMEGGGENE